MNWLLNGLLIMNLSLKKISVFVYLLSFVVPAFVIDIIGQESVIFGYSAFILGAVNLERFDYFFCWLANIFYLWSLIRVNSYLVLKVISINSVFLALLLPIIFYVKEENAFLRFGYGLWLSSFILNVFAVFKEYVKKSI
jgi:hypothetical protein